MSNTNRRTSTGALIASAASIVTTTITGAVCGLPLAAALLGVGGLGWLTQYSYLGWPASVVTLVLLVFGLWHSTRGGCSTERPARGGARLATTLVWLATVAAATVNLLEYVVLPRLG